MKKLAYLCAMVLIAVSATAGADEAEPGTGDDYYACVGGDPVSCSYRWVTCVGIYGGQLDPNGSGKTVCEVKYETCLEGYCFPVN